MIFVGFDVQNGETLLAGQEGDVESVFWLGLRVVLKKRSTTGWRVEEDEEDEEREEKQAVRIMVQQLR